VESERLKARELEVLGFVTQGLASKEFALAIGRTGEYSTRSVVSYSVR
jgi:DNA-binding CsgD family transcriptional regulator